MIKRSVNKRLVEVTRRMAHGSAPRAAVLLRRSRRGNLLNTAFIERFNGTMRERLATLTRKCRHAARRLEALHTGMYLLGCTYKFCWFHQELGKHREGTVVTPVMAAGLTDHVWSPLELLSCKVAPAPWVAAKRRRQPYSFELRLTGYKMAISLILFGIHRYIKVVALIYTSV